MRSATGLPARSSTASVASSDSATGKARRTSSAPWVWYCAVVLWTTRYMDLALGQLRQAGYPVRDEDVARLPPLGFKHLNFLGRYAFTTPTPSQLRALRDPSAIEDEEEDEE